MSNTDNVTSFAVPIILLAFLFMPLGIYAQSGDQTVNRLIDMGFENVRWSEDRAERVYVIENIAYRLNGVGIGKAIDLIQELGLPEKKNCRLIVTDNNVPQISLYYHYAESDSVQTVDRSDWEVTYNLGENWKMIRKEKKRNSSLYKVDVVIYPELSIQNVIVTQIYQVLFNFSPAVEISLWNGMKLTGQIVIPVYNDGYGDRAGKVRPGFLSISQNLRLPGNIFATASIGLFNSDRYGIDLKLFRPFSNEHFSLEGRISYTGTGYWDGFNYEYGTKKRVTWSIGGNYYWARYNTIASLKVEEYFLHEKAIRFEFIRSFRYASIGFYAAKADDKRSELNYGFRFQVALPPYKYKRNKYYPRVLPSKNMGMNYNASNERYFYRTFRTQPGDNIMQQNNFNPYYIKSELLNF